MGDLTKNFSRYEFACPCCGKDDIDIEHVNNLQIWRDNVGVPILIMSGVRCKKKNKLAGGKKNSRHLRCIATDCHVIGMTVEQMYESAVKIDAFKNGGIGKYPDNKMIHVDSGPHIARWTTRDPEKKKERQDGQAKK